MANQIIDTVSSRLRQQQTTSPERRRYLEQLARLMCREYNPTVNFRDIPTARCRHNQGEIDIDVGREIVDQTVTSLAPDVWSLVAQEGLIVHEIGHVLYTDFDAHESIKNDLGMKEMNAFHDIVWNPAEDAAIEEQLRWKFDCSRELDTYNANLFTRQKAGAQNLPIPQAVKIAILEKGCYDAGAVDEHVNEERNLVEPSNRTLFDQTILPEVNQMLADVMTEPDPGVRYERMLEFWHWLKDLMRDENGDDAASQAQQGGGYDDAKPDDTSGMTPGEMADALEDLDEDEVREQLEQIAQPPQQHDWDDILEDEDEGDEAEDGQPGAGGDEAGEDGDEDDEPSLGDLFGSPDGDDEGAEDEPSTDDSGAGDADGDGEDPSEGADSDDSQSGGDSGGDDGEEDGDDESDGEAGSDGSEPGDGGSSDAFPGHEGHRLVLRD